jgi:hypothetical protein
MVQLQAQLIAAAPLTQKDESLRINGQNGSANSPPQLLFSTIGNKIRDARRVKPPDSLTSDRLKLSSVR